MPHTTQSQETPQWAIDAAKEYFKKTRENIKVLGGVAAIDKAELALAAIISRHAPKPPHCDAQQLTVTSCRFIYRQDAMKEARNVESFAREWQGFANAHISDACLAGTGIRCFTVSSDGLLIWIGTYARDNNRDFE